MTPGTVITRNDVTKEFGWIYALLLHGRAYYVGQTIDPHGRFSAHLKAHHRNPATIMLVLDGPIRRGPALDATESEWIERLDTPGAMTVGEVTFEHGSLDNADYYTRVRREMRQRA